MQPAATPDDVAAQLATAQRALEEGDENTALTDLTRAVGWLRELGREMDQAEAFISYVILDERLAAVRTAVDSGEDAVPAIRRALQHADQITATLLGGDRSYPELAS